MVAFCIQTLLFAVHRHVGSPPINTIETVWKVKTKIIRPRKTAFRFWKNPKLPISSRISSASIITLLGNAFFLPGNLRSGVIFFWLLWLESEKNNALLPKTNHKVDHRETAWSQATFQASRFPRVTVSLRDFIPRGVDHAGRNFLVVPPVGHLSPASLASSCILPSYPNFGGKTKSNMMYLNKALA